MNYPQYTAWLLTALLAGCHSKHPSQDHSSQPIQRIELSSEDIQAIDASNMAITAPGISVGNATLVSHISSNFGHARIDIASGTLIFSPSESSEGTAHTSSVTAANLAASTQNYRFKISYQVDDQTYQISGFALPLFKDEQGQVSARYTKLNKEGSPLIDAEQVLPKESSDWSCVRDNASNLTWQVPQVNGDFAFDTTYYWADRQNNNRDFSPATCHLDGDCNTNNLVRVANEQRLCSHTDWRLPTRNEWKTILDDQMFDAEKRQSPIDPFFFPYMDANFDEAYWTATFTQYPAGHDIQPVEGDWQGSNATVGSAYVMWMANDFADERMPPRSTNEPRLSILVRGNTIADPLDDTIDELTVSMTPEVNAEGNEDTTWQQRFVKRGELGQPLRDQNAKQWHCTQDNHYSDALPNTDILWQRVSPVTTLMNYSQAEAFVIEVNQRTLCGRNDWRLPSETELKSLYIDTFAFNMEGISYRTGYSQSVFNDTVVAENSYYWTQTKDLYDPETKNIAVAFQQAWSESSGRPHQETHRVRLISTSRAQQ